MAASSAGRPSASASPAAGGLSSRAFAVLAGALICTIGDHLHVAYGVLYYTHPVLFQQALWVYPLFAVATFSMLAPAERIRVALSGEAVASNVKEALLATGAFFVAYAFTAVAAERPSLVLFVLVATWLLRMRGLPRWLVAFSCMAAVAGVACESALSHLGLFYYVEPDFLGVPRWLPGLYLHAALAAPRIAAAVGFPAGASRAQD